MSELREEPEDLDDNTHKVRPQISISHLRIPGAFLDPPSPELETTPEIEEVAFTPIVALQPTSPIEPILDLIVEQAISPAVSIPTTPLSSMSAERRNHRPKTRFALAHPPPTGVQLKKKGIIRPSTLFQLHTQTSSGYHRPAYEVLPLNLLEQSNKCAQFLKRIGKGKLTVGAKDLVIIKGNSHSPLDQSQNSEDPSLHDVVGIISSSEESGPNSKSAQIILDTATCTISQKRPDSYEISLQGEDKQCGRWYIPKTQRRASLNSAAFQSPKFYFAAINPHAKKHPTVACLNRSYLDIYDSYTVLGDEETPSESASAVDYLDSGRSIDGTPTMKETDEGLRKLIVISSIWIAFCEGWSPHMSTAVDSSSTICKSTTPKRASSVSAASTSNTASTANTGSLRSRSIRRGLIRRSTIDNSSPLSLKILAQPEARQQEMQQILGRENAPASATSIISNALGIQHIPDTEISSSPLQDPTAQFRHLLAIDRPAPSRSPVSKMDTLMRRRSTHTPAAFDKTTPRIRSASWTRRLSLHHSKGREPISIPTSIASSEFDSASLAGEDSHDQISQGETNPTSLSMRSACVSRSTSRAPSPKIEPISVRVDSILSNVESEPLSLGPAVAEVRERRIQPAETATTPVKPATPPPAMAQLVDRREISTPTTPRPKTSSASSSPSMHMGIGADGPGYWQDFDRIQAKSFVHRAERHMMQLEADLYKENEAAKNVDGRQTRGSGWFNSIKRSVSRRRG